MSDQEIDRLFREKLRERPFEPSAEDLAAAEALLDQRAAGGRGGWLKPGAIIALVLVSGYFVYRTLIQQATAPTVQREQVIGKNDSQAEEVSGASPNTAHTPTVKAGETRESNNTSSDLASEPTSTPSSDKGEAMSAESGSGRSDGNNGPSPTQRASSATHRDAVPSSTLSSNSTEHKRGTSHRTASAGTHATTSSEKRTPDASPDQASAPPTTKDVTRNALVNAEPGQGSERSYESIEDRSHDPGKGDMAATGDTPVADPDGAGSIAALTAPDGASGDDRRLEQKDLASPPPSTETYGTMGAPALPPVSMDPPIAATALSSDSSSTGTAPKDSTNSTPTLPQEPTPVRTGPRSELHLFTGLARTGSSLSTKPSSTSRTLPVYGLEYALKFGKASVASGVGYSSYGETTESRSAEQQVVSETNTYIIADSSMIDTSGQIQFGDTIAVITDYDTAFVPGILTESRLRVSYLEVPLLLGYEQPLGRWSLGAQGGVFIGFLTARDGRFPVADTRSTIAIADESFQTVSIGYLLRPCLKYRLNEHWSIGVEPFVKGHLVDIVREGSLSGLRYSGWGGNIGLFWRPASRRTPVVPGP